MEGYKKLIDYDCILNCMNGAKPAPKDPQEYCEKLNSAMTCTQRCENQLVGNITCPTGNFQYKVRYYSGSSNYHISSNRTSNARYRNSSFRAPPSNRASVPSYEAIEPPPPPPNHVRENMGVSAIFLCVDFDYDSWKCALANIEDVLQAPINRKDIGCSDLVGRVIDGKTSDCDDEKDRFVLFLAWMLANFNCRRQLTVVISYIITPIGPISLSVFLFSLIGQK